MTDRELLELAAKAVGVELQPMEVKNVSHIGDDRFIGYMVSADKWPRGWFNPLTDDGDALRLAVKLGFKVFHEFGKTAVIHYSYEAVIREEYSSNGNDAFAATRRAIVRAAASMWKAMP